MTRNELLTQLKRIRDDATMDNSSFHVGEEPFPFGADCTDLVRAATRLWRHSWIVGPLNEIIADLESAAGKPEGRQ